LYKIQASFLSNFGIINSLKFKIMSTTNVNASKKTEDKKTTKKESTDKTSGKDSKAVKKTPAKK